MAVPGKNLKVGNTHGIAMHKLEGQNKNGCSMYKLEERNTWLFQEITSGKAKLLIRKYLLFG